jgi:colanic acid biosynthesis glycosyl transferase WcaI
MRLLFISQLFDPEYAIKGIKFLENLQKTGAQVEVITTFPNYPTGKVFDGYKVKLWQVEQHDHIRIIRVYSLISHSKSKIARALNYLTFMFSAFIASLFIRKPDIIYAYHPQFTVGLMAVLLKWIRRIPFITDVQDLWPDALNATGLQQKGLFYKVIYKLCNLIYKQAAHVIVLSEGYKQALTERGINPDKITVVYNWYADKNTAVDAPRSSTLLLPQNYVYKFVYAGNLGAAQSLKSVIDAFARLEQHAISLIIIGSGIEETELKTYAAQLNSRNIFFLGYVSSEKITDYLAEADALVVHLRDQPLFKITIPSKVQASLNSAKPILMAVGGEANQIIQNANAGVTAKPQNPESIAEAALQLVAVKDRWQAMGASGQLYYNQYMAMDIGAKKIVGILQQALNSNERIQYD